MSARSITVHVTTDDFVGAVNDIHDCPIANALSREHSWVSPHIGGDRAVWDCANVPANPMEYILPPEALDFISQFDTAYEQRANGWPATTEVPGPITFVMVPAY